MSRDYDDDYDERRDVDRTTTDEYDVDEDRAWEPADDDDVARRTAATDDEAVYSDGREDDDSWLGIGLASILLIVGALLFLFPEPGTSLLGIGLMVAGLVVWAIS